MEVGAVAARGDVAGADDEVAEALARLRAPSRKRANSGSSAATMPS